MLRLELLCDVKLKKKFFNLKRMIFLAKLDILYYRIFKKQNVIIHTLLPNNLFIVTFLTLDGFALFREYWKNIPTIFTFQITNLTFRGYHSSH